MDSENDQVNLLEWAEKAPVDKKGPVLVIPNVFLGNRFGILCSAEMFSPTPFHRKHANDIRRLRSLGITHVVNCGAGQNTFEDSLSYIKVSIQDKVEADLLGVIEPALEFMRDAIQRGGKVLVHWYAVCIDVFACIFKFFFFFIAWVDSLDHRLWSADI
jgi:hypothetical protein